MTLMPEFRRQLLEAAASRADEPGPWRPGFGLPRSRGVPRPRLGVSIAAAASILVVIAVVAVVLTLGHTDRGAGMTGGQRNGSEVPGVAASRAQLVGELGALRRGHASKLAPHVALPFPGGRLQIDRSLVRIVHTDGYKVTLIPATHAAGGSASSRRTTGLVVTVQGPNVPSGFPAIGKGTTTISRRPVSPATIARQGDIFVVYVSGTLNRAVVIVPDGVTRVRLSRFVPDRSSGGRVAAIAPASAPVHNNVAVISLPGVTTTALHQTQRTLHYGGVFSRHHCHVDAALDFVPVSVRMIWWRKTDSGSGLKARATTVQTSLNAYSTTLLPPAPCRHSPNR